MQRLQGGEAFFVLFRFNMVTGATIAFRARFKDLVLPIPADTISIHDGWIALMIASVADIAFIEAPLIHYRQHPGQQIGALAIPTRKALPDKHYLGHRRQLEEIAARWPTRGKPHSAQNSTYRSTPQSAQVPRSTLAARAQRTPATSLSPLLERLLQCRPRSLVLSGSPH